MLNTDGMDMAVGCLNMSNHSIQTKGSFLEQEKLLQH